MYQTAVYLHLWQALLQHVRIPEMQVFPAYDPLLSLDKRGHSCEAAALAYEERMRSVLGAENGLPALDLVPTSTNPKPKTLN